MVGIQSHGQGLETALSQVAYQELGINPAQISVRHGDTGAPPSASAPSRRAAWSCLAAPWPAPAAYCATRSARSAPTCCNARPASVRCEEGKVIGRSGRSHRRDRQDRAPANARAAARGGAAARASPRPTSRASAPGSSPTRRTAPSSPSTRRPARSSCSISRWPRIAARWSIRCWSRPDPRRRRAGHRHRAMRGDPLRQGGPAARRHLPRLPPAGAAELPPIRIAHLHTPTTATEYGMKGMGEGGAVAPPAAIANAVRDALAAHRRRSQPDPDHPARCWRRSGRRSGGASIEYSKEYSARAAVEHFDACGKCRRCKMCLLSLWGTRECSMLPTSPVMRAACGSDAGVAAVHDEVRAGHERRFFAR